MLGILTYQYASDNNIEKINGIPLNWPMEVININNENELPDSRWIAMSISDYNNYVENLKNSYNEWANNKEFFNKKENLKKEVNSYRDILLSGKIKFKNTYWDIDDKSKLNLSGVSTLVVAGVPLPNDFSWRDALNNNVPMTGSELINLGAIFVMYINMIYNYSWYLKEQIDLLTNENDLNNFDIYNNWPSNDFNN